MGRSIKGLTYLLRGRDTDATTTHFADGLSRDDDLTDMPLGRDEKFNVEALEPRILLSADPSSASLAALSDDAERVGVAPIIQQIDAELEELASGLGDASADGADSAAEDPVIDFSLFDTGDDEETGHADVVGADASAEKTNDISEIEAPRASFADVGGVLTLDLTDETEAETILLTISNTDALAGTATVTVSGTTTSGAALVNAGTFDDVGAIIGSQSLGVADTIQAQNVQNDWILTSINVGTLNGMSFTDIENFTGGTASLRA